MCHLTLYFWEIMSLGGTYHIVIKGYSFVTQKSYLYADCP